YQQKVMLRQVGTNHQAGTNNQEKANQTGKQAGLDKSDGDQDRHKGPGGFDPDQNAKNDDQQYAYRHQQNTLEQSLLFQWQTVDGNIQQAFFCIIPMFEHLSRRNFLADNGKTHI